MMLSLCWISFEKLAHNCHKNIIVALFKINGHNSLVNKSRLPLIFILFPQKSNLKKVSVFLLFKLKGFYIRSCIITKNVLKELVSIVVIDKFDHNLIKTKTNVKYFSHFGLSKVLGKTKILYIFIPIYLWLCLEEYHHKK